MNRSPLKLGESGWEVEWLSKYAHNEFGDVEPDECTYEYRYFRTKSAAVRFAKKILPQSPQGMVRVTPFRIEPLSDEWPYGRSKEYTGDSEYIEDTP